MANYFRVAIQHEYKYDVHIFEDENHFKAWMRVHPTKCVLPISRASGRKYQEFNHIGELDFAVADMRMELLTA